MRGQIMSEKHIVSFDGKKLRNKLRLAPFIHIGAQESLNILTPEIMITRLVMVLIDSWENREHLDRASINNKKTGLPTDGDHFWESPYFKNFSTSAKISLR